MTHSYTHDPSYTRDPLDPLSLPSDEGGGPLAERTRMRREAALFPKSVAEIIADPDEAYESLGIKNIPLPEFQRLARIISDNFGIFVGPNKRMLVTGRVHPMLDRHGFADYGQLLNAIETDTSGTLLSELANHISTNHTAFYREDAHFRLLREQVLPDLAERKRAEGNLDLRIWCAACATGEEAYTILFTIMDYLGLGYSKWRAGVLATDISAAALDIARKGIYDESRLTPIPFDVLQRYFVRYDSTHYRIKPEIAKEVTFRRLNLMNKTYPFKKPFDVIFCRNVMIYLSRPVRLALLSRLREWLAPGGVLFMGHSESLVGAHPEYDYIAPAAYRRTK